MERVGSQVKLPLKKAIQIAIQGIRIRFGRSLVTISGVMLGIAFLMSNLTAQLIKGGISHERELRQTVNLMESMIRGEVGNPQGKRLGVAVFGAMSPAEEKLVEHLRATSVELQAFGTGLHGLRSTNRSEVGRDVALLLVLGDDLTCPASLKELLGGAAEKILLDSQTKRVFAEGECPGARCELFFGKETEENVLRLRERAEQARFRTLWIVTVSILVTVVGVANALLMSVTERFREIGTMKCLGALSGFIRRLFLIESAMIGFAGSVIGTLVGALIPLLVHGFTYDFGLVLGTLSYARLLGAAVFCIGAGTAMSMIAAIYPANFAAKMVPASALRTNI